MCVLDLAPTHSKYANMTVAQHCIHNVKATEQHNVLICLWLQASNDTSCDGGGSVTAHALSSRFYPPSDELPGPLLT